MRVPLEAFVAEWEEVDALKANSGRDRFGRQFTPAQSCLPPYHAVKVTGALFHTQGGLAIDGVGRVKRKDGTLLPNLFAAGGAAAGVSGSTAAGYLSGNGLLDRDCPWPFGRARRRCFGGSLRAKRPPGKKDVRDRI